MDPILLSRYVSDGFDHAKAGNAAEIYSNVAPYHDSGELDLKSHYAFGWIIYYAMHQASETAIDERKRMLARYLKLKVQKPHKLHSMILTEAIRLYKDARDVREAIRISASGKHDRRNLPTFSILKFFSLWDAANLREGDWRRRDVDGQQLPSTVEKLITCCVDEAEETRQNPSESVMTIIEKALELFPDSGHLLAQGAQIASQGGDRPRATSLLRKAILTTPAKYFLWSRLAEMVSAEQEDVKLPLSLYCRALSCPGAEDFKGKIHLAMAELWERIGAAPQAAWELERYRRLYQSRDWHLSPRAMALMEKIPEDTVPSDPTPAYKRIAALADEALYAELTPVAVSKNYHKPADNRPDRYGRVNTSPAWRVADAEGTNYWFTPSRHGIDPDLPHGTRLHIRVHNGRVVDAALAPAE